MRRIRDVDAGLALTIPAHIKESILKEMEGQLVASVSELPSRLPELIHRLTEAPNSASEGVDQCDPSD